MITVALLLASLLLAQPPAPARPHQPAPAAAQPARVTPATTPASRGTNNVWTARHNSFTKRAEQGSEKGDMGIIFLGDSITEGWEQNGAEIWAKTYAPRHAVNFGIGGDRTQHVLWRIQNGNLEGLDAPEKGSPPKLVVIMIGTNNVGADTADDIAAGIGAIVRTTREKLPQAKVLLLAVFPRGKRSDDPARAKIAQVNRIASKLADDKSVYFEDIGPKFLQPDGSLSAEIMPDYLHLSKKGYQIWADAMDPKVAELLGEQKPASENPSKPAKP
jgi:lysophospholipase L1-like esterase